MSLRQMEYFLTVVEEQSFTRAAELLHVSQPALSHQIKALELSVGGALLERMPRGVRLTSMGRAFLPHAELAVRSAVQARRAARAAAGADGGELHVAAVHSVAVGVLPDVFARWRAAHPAVVLRLREYATAEALRESVARGTADLAVGHAPADWTGSVETFGEEEIVLVVPFQDRFAGRTTVRLTELADLPWIRCAMEPYHQGELFLDRACGQAGFRPRTAVHTEHTSTAVRMAAAGVGVCTAPSHVVRGVVGENCVVLSVDPPWRRPLTVFARKPPAGAAARFVAVLRTVWGELGDGGESGGAGRRRTVEGRPASPTRRVPSTPATQQGPARVSDRV